jgi:hypothetical protein
MILTVSRRGYPSAAATVEPQAVGTVSDSLAVPIAEGHGTLTAGYGDGGDWLPSFSGGGGGRGGNIIHSLADWGERLLSGVTSRAIVQAMRAPSAPAFQPATGPSSPGTTINFHGTNVIENRQARRS